MSKLRWIILALPVYLCAQDPDIDTVKSILLRQQSDWNNGDINAFMVGYWQSDSLQFVGPTEVTYGWENTRQNYHRRYPDQATMGRLSFDIIDVRKLGPDAIMLIGKYTLHRAQDKPSGHFLLNWKRISDEWVIIADCTSS